MAKYHLIAAEEVLNPLEVLLTPNPEVHAAQADLARSWVYYGLQLFETSRKTKTLKDIEDSNKEDATDDEKTEAEKPAYTFQGLRVKLPKDIPVSSLHSVEEAKILFTSLQKWIKRARLFYTLRDYPLQYVNLCLDLSELYRFVAFYEEDIESQYTIQKKRYDALENLITILKEVRPNCYVAVNVEVTKELIEVQMELMNLNLKKLYTPGQVLASHVESENVLKRKVQAFQNLNSRLEKVSTTLNSCTWNLNTENAENLEENVHAPSCKANNANPEVFDEL